MLLDVVADKTGYPAEMLALEMDLEGDLGVDSIKRVEILSAMKERVPGLPEVDPAEMGALRTLGQIVEKLAAEGPSLPFDHAAADREVELPRNTDPRLGRFELRAVPAPASGLVRPLPDGGMIAVVGGPEAVAEAVVDALRGAGRDAARLDLDALASADPAGLVLLHGLADPTADIEGVHLDAFEAARRCAESMSTRGGLLVTVQDTGGDFGLSGAGERAWLSGFAGLARTATQEWPAAVVKAIDIEQGGRDPAAIARALVQEILDGGPELEVGLGSDEQRITLRDERVDLVRPGSPPLGSDDVVVVSGGGRGVTAATVVALARATGARFLLLGRTVLADEPPCCAGVDGDAALKRALLADARARGETPRPAAIGRQVATILANREIRRTLARIEQAGGKARYASVDITDVHALQAALHRVRADWGPITGVIHGAGVLRDKRIADKSRDDFLLVWRTKVAGLQALLDATATDPLRVLAVFSSVAARCGNQGQVDYAMANEVLNKVAQAEATRRPGCVVRSLGWGPWEGGMVTPALKARFESLGVPLIPLDVGARMLVDELAGDRPDAVGLVLGGRPRIGRPLASTGPDEMVLTIHVRRDRHPYLADHAIDGVPVVPVVLVVEWFARAARAFRSDLHLAGIEQLKVLRGVRLQGFDADGDTLHIAVRQLDNGDGVLLALELRDPAGRPHYRALARLQESPRPVRATPPPVALEPWDGPIYGDPLFHGPRFQVIRDVEGVSAEGCAARLDGVEAAGWSFDAWQTDVAALDGGLQLALLWTRRALGGASLPTAVGRIHLGRIGKGRLRAVLTGRTASAGKGLSDLVLVDADGVTVAELHDIETHLLPRG
ncbi:MAG: SDR family oxidoreductase [Deltaproteobacteria bacterium]|nr:MAG: SDR family oxidoreductase [Deltaproteobacteria bacterium]